MAPNCSPPAFPAAPALSYNNPHQALHEDFGTLRTDYILGAKDKPLRCLDH